MNNFVDTLKARVNGAIEANEVRRLFHGRGGTIEEYDYLNIDFYPPAIFITVFKDVDYSQLLNEVISEYGDKLSIILQERFNKVIRPLSLGLELPERHVVCEHGLSYLVDLEHNQNTGFFIDMKDKREQLSRESSGKNILNLFSYTCSLSVAAKKGGAKQVVNIDQKKTFLNVGRENHRLNDLDNGVIYKSWDILKSFNQIGKLGPFDIIISDPPSNQGKSFYYKKDYKKLIRRMAPFIKEGGEFVACLNSPFEDISFLEEIFSSLEDKWKLKEVKYSPSEYEELDKAKGLKIGTFVRCSD